MGKMMSEETREKEEEEEVLPGFRFHPTDEELVGFYLRRKVGTKKPFSTDIIKQLDIYKYNPWDLPREACTVGGQEKEWYFFCLRGRKYRNSVRPNRVTGSGFWKATGIDRPIYSSGSGSGSSGGSGSNEGVCIGLKKSLVYYRGSAGKGTKTDWMMHEYRLPAAVNNNDHPPEAEIWTICRIFEKNISFMKKYTQNRKQSTTNQVPTDQSSSKSSSFESDTNYYEARNYQQLLPTVQAPTPAALHPSVVVPQSADTDDNWDELGRMTDFLVDTIPGSECTHYW